MRRITKKILLLFLTFIAAISICGCGQQDVTLKLGETAVMEEQIAITPVNILVMPQIYAPVNEENSLGLSAGEGSTYVVIEAEVENLSEETVTVDQAVQFRLTGTEGSSEGLLSAVLTDGGKNMKTSPDLEAGQRAEFYFIVEMSESDMEDNMTAEFALIEEDREPVFRYKLATNLTEPVAVYRELSRGDTVTADDFKLTAENISFAEKLEPENPGYYYAYLEARTEDESLLIAELHLENTSEEGKSISDLCGVRIVTRDGNFYLGGMAAEDREKANIISEGKVAAGEERTVYALASLPASAKDGNCRVYLYVDGTYYLWTYETAA